MEKKIHEELVNIYGGESNTIEVPLAGQRPEHSRNSKDSSQYIMLYRACFQGNLVDPHHTSQTHRLTKNSFTKNKQVSNTSDQNQKQDFVMLIFF